MNPIMEIVGQVEALIVGGAIATFLGVLAKHLADGSYNVGKRLLKVGFENLKKLARHYL